MSGCRRNIWLIVVMVMLSSVQAYSQQMKTDTSIAEDKPGAALYKPVLHYSAGSSFLVAPHFGSLSAVTLSPVLSVPLSPKLTVEGGIMATYYYSAPWKTENSGFPYGYSAGLSVYGSATYQFTPQLTLFGSAVRQVAGASSFYSIPKSSYTIGSAYNFGNFSIGVTLQMSNWDNIYSPFRSDSPQGFYTPFGQNSVIH